MASQRLSIKDRLGVARVKISVCEYGLKYTELTEEQRRDYTQTVTEEGQLRELLPRFINLGITYMDELDTFIKVAGQCDDPKLFEGFFTETSGTFEEKLSRAETMCS